MRILVVDDDPSCRRVVRGLLKAVAEVDLISNGSDALSAVARAQLSGSPYDIAFLDIMMPGMDGLQLLELLRAQERGSTSGSIRIIMLTSLSLPNVTRLAASADALLTKPISKAELFAALAASGVSDPSATSE